MVQLKLDTFTLLFLLFDLALLFNRYKVQVWWP